MIGLNQILTAAILGLCGWIWYQSDTISDIRAENQAQAQTIETQSATISKLKQDAVENQRVMLELSKQESEARSQSDEVIRTIPQQVKQSNAYNANAPSNVIEFLRK